MSHTKVTVTGNGIHVPAPRANTLDPHTFFIGRSLIDETFKPELCLRSFGGDGDGGLGGSVQFLQRGIWSSDPKQVEVLQVIEEISITVVK